VGCEYRLAKSLAKSLEGHGLGVNGVFWTSDSSDDKTVKLWDPRIGPCLKTMQGHKVQVFACCINPQSSPIAFSSRDCTVRLWDVRNGKSLKVVPTHMDPISSVVFNRGRWRPSNVLGALLSSRQGTTCLVYNPSGSSHNGGDRVCRATTQLVAQQ